MNGPDISSIQPPSATAVASASGTQGKQLNSVAQNEGQTAVDSGNNSPQESVSTAQLAEVVSSISDYVQSISRDLEFRVDDETGSTVVNVFDSKTETLVRQIPSEEALALAQYIETYAADPLKGLLLDGKG